MLKKNTEDRMNGRRVTKEVYKNTNGIIKLWGWGLFHDTVRLRNAKRWFLFFVGACIEREVIRWGTRRGWFCRVGPPGKLPSSDHWREYQHHPTKTENSFFLYPLSQTPSMKVIYGTLVLITPSDPIMAHKGLYDKCILPLTSN